MHLDYKHLFGANVTLDQTGNFLTINKSDLEILPASDQRAEILFAAIIRKASENFFGTLTDSDGNLITAPSGEPISYDNSVLYKSLLVTLWNKQLSNSGYYRHIFILEHDELNYGT